MAKENGVPEDREVAVYGCTVDQMNAGFDQALKLFCSTIMLATSILSDAQELIALGHDEAARHYINRVKYLINNRPMNQDVRSATPLVGVG